MKELDKESGSTSEAAPKKGRKPNNWEGYTGPYFGDLVRAARLRRSWTVYKMAKRLKCDARVIKVVEECKQPLGCELMTFLNVCSLLKMEPERIIKRISDALKAQGKIVQ